MLSRKPLTAALLGATAVLLLFTPTGRAVSQSIREVFVVNFPEIQKVEGRIRIDGVVHLAEMRKFKDVLVPPVAPTETTRLVEAGTLDATGFSTLVLSLHGSVRGDVKRTGDVGVMLIPDEENIGNAFHEQGMLHFVLETAATGVSMRTPYFASVQPRFNVAFERYRVLMYNTTDKAVTVDLFAYLSH